MASSWKSLSGVPSFTPDTMFLMSRHVEVSGDLPAGKVAVAGSTYFGEVDRGIAQKTVSHEGDC
jgi:hypothetical protein